MILFFDGCHKIYYASPKDKETINKMRGWGYDPFHGNSDDLQDLWENSCSLRFIQHADFADDAPEIRQSDEREDVYEFATEIEEYLARY